MVATRNTDTRLDGLEKVAGDLDKKTTAFTAMVDELKVQCSSTNDRVSALGSQLESFMTEVRAALTTGIPTRSTGPGPSGAPGDSSTSVTTNGGNSTLTMPSFDGSDTMSWLARAEQYFMVSNTLLEKRLDVAMVTLAGPVLPWFQLLQKRLPSLTWDRFQLELMKRFGDNMALDSYEAFASTRHDGSLIDFVAALEARLAQIPDLSDHQYLGFFLAALRPEVRMHMKVANITCYSDAVQMALQLDHLAGTTHKGTSVSSQSATGVPASRPSPKVFSPSPQSFSSPGSNRPNRRFRNISSEEYKKHIAAGTCFRCGLKFGPSHRLLRDVPRQG